MIGGTSLAEWHSMTPQQQLDWQRRYPQKVNPVQWQRSLEMSRAMSEKMHKECKLPRTEPYSIGSGKTRVEVTGFYIK
jgi:hypothetical protein